MDDTTSLLFGLDSFRVVDVVRVADRLVRVVSEPLSSKVSAPAVGSERPDQAAPARPGGDLGARPRMSRGARGRVDYRCAR